MEDLSLHVLDVAENALAAGADRIEVRIDEDTAEGILSIEIEDSGCGMDEQTANRILDPFYTSKPAKRVGLGLPLLAQAAREAGGELQVNSVPGEGTSVTATFRLGHIDLKPLGDMLATMATLACAHPGVELSFRHRRDGAVVLQWPRGSIGLART